MWVCLGRQDLLHSTTLAHTHTLSRKINRCRPRPIRTQRAAGSEECISLRAAVHYGAGVMNETLLAINF